MLLPDMQGRWIKKTKVGPQETQITLENWQGQMTLVCKEDLLHEIPFGSWVKWEDSKITLLTPNRAGGKTTFRDQLMSEGRRKALKTRGDFYDHTRAYFKSLHFTEVDTPVLVPCPGMEVHIRPIRTAQSDFLPTSPEFALKRLLSGGVDRLFQICKSFRDEPASPAHHREFTMLEWYRAFDPLTAIQEDCENWISAFAKKAWGSFIGTYQGKRLDLTPPWPRRKVEDLFYEATQIPWKNLQSVESMRRCVEKMGHAWQEEDTWDDLFFRVWLNFVEPAFPSDRPIFVTDFPASQAALAKKYSDANGFLWAERFEFYIAGLELGNAFYELTDPDEQRKRFVDDMNLREKIYGDKFPKNPIDENFLQALAQGLPPCAGIAVGMDRLIMLFADAKHIDETLWLRYPEETEK